MTGRSILPGIDQGHFLPRWLAGGSHATRAILKAVSLVQTKTSEKEMLQARPCPEVQTPLNTAYTLTAHRGRAAGRAGRGEGWPLSPELMAVRGVSTCQQQPTLCPRLPFTHWRAPVPSRSLFSWDACCRRLRPAHTQHCHLCSLHGWTEWVLTCPPPMQSRK